MSKKSFLNNNPLRTTVMLKLKKPIAQSHLRIITLNACRYFDFQVQGGNLGLFRGRRLSSDTSVSDHSYRDRQTVRAPALPVDDRP